MENTIKTAHPILKLINFFFFSFLDFELLNLISLKALTEFFSSVEISVNIEF